MLLTILKKCGIIMMKQEENVEKTKNCIEEIEYLIQEYEKESSENAVKNFYELLDKLKSNLDNEAGDK